MASGARAFVLAAGLGTRLRPLTDTWPKPAVPFLGAPLLRRAFAVLARAGVDRVALNTHHLREMAGVERDAGHPSPRKDGEGAPEQRRAEERDRRLRPGVGQRAEARPQTRGEDEGSRAPCHQRSSGT